MKPIKNHSALVAASIALGILSIVYQSGSRWHMAADEFMIGQVASIGFATVTSYLVLRWLWPKR